MKKIPIILSIFILITFLANCSSLSSNVNEYNKTNLSKIKNWQITFTYPTSSFEEKTTASGAKEKTVKNVQHADNIQLLDDIYFNLKDKGLSIDKARVRGYGIIQIHPVYTFDVQWGGYYKRMDIRIKDNVGNLMYRITLNNVAKVEPPAEGNEVAQRAADEIYKILTKKK